MAKVPRSILTRGNILLLEFQIYAAKPEMPILPMSNFCLVCENPDCKLCVLRENLKVSGLSQMGGSDPHLSLCISRVSHVASRIVNFRSTYTVWIGKQGSDHFTSIRSINRVLDFCLPTQYGIGEQGSDLVMGIRLN